MVAYRSKRARLHLATCCDVIALLLGIGVAMVTVSALVGIYYNMIIAWAIYYLFASFTSKLPWEECHKDWASECKSNRRMATIEAAEMSLRYLHYKHTKPK